MNTLLILGYETAAAFIPFFVVISVLSWIYKKNRNKKMNTGHIVSLLVFAVYITGVFHVTGAGTIWDALRYHFEIKSWQINFAPFSNEIDIIAYVLNIVLFIPLGILLPYINIKMNKVRYPVLIGMLFSLVIELSQLVNNRSTDIDDFILNTVGAVIGYGIFNITVKICRIRHQETDYCKYEAVIIMVIMFIGRFLLYDEFKLAKLLYGF